MVYWRHGNFVDRRRFFSLEVVCQDTLSTREKAKNNERETVV